MSQRLSHLRTEPCLTESLAIRLLAEDQRESKLTCIFTNAGEAHIYQEWRKEPLLTLTGMDSGELLTKVQGIGHDGFWTDEQEDEYQFILRDALDEYGCDDNKGGIL